MDFLSMAFERMFQNLSKGQSGEINIISMVLIIIVVIALVAIFQDNMTEIVSAMFDKIRNSMGI